MGFEAAELEAACAVCGGTVPARALWVCLRCVYEVPDCAKGQPLPSMPVILLSIRVGGCPQAGTPGHSLLFSPSILNPWPPSQLKVVCTPATEREALEEGCGWAVGTHRANTGPIPLTWCSLIRSQGLGPLSARDRDTQSHSVPSKTRSSEQRHRLPLLRCTPLCPCWASPCLSAPYQDTCQERPLQGLGRGWAGLSGWHLPGPRGAWVLPQHLRPTKPDQHSGGFQCLRVLHVSALKSYYLVHI